MEDEGSIGIDAWMGGWMDGGVGDVCCGGCVWGVAGRRGVYLDAPHGQERSRAWMLAARGRK